MLRQLFIYGAGGHGQVVADAAISAGWRMAGFIDGAAITDQRIGAWRVLLPWPQQAEGDHLIIAVGDNAARARLLDEAGGRGWRLASVVHPSAWVSPTAQLGSGVFIGAQAVVNAAAVLGDGVIVNSGAIVEHHCNLGRCAHVAPGACLAGGVVVGARALVGIGAAARPRVTIGADCVIGAGAAVVANVPDGATALGVPARVASNR